MVVKLLKGIKGKSSKKEDNKLAPYRGNETALEPVEITDPVAIMSSLEEKIIDEIPELDRKYEEVMEYVLIATPLEYFNSTQEKKDFDLATVLYSPKYEYLGGPVYHHNWAKNIGWDIYSEVVESLLAKWEKKDDFHEFFTSEKDDHYPLKTRKLELQNATIEYSKKIDNKETLQKFVGMAGIYIQGKKLGAE